MKKFGIMGGTFNPIHYGHLFLAENAREQLMLDKILFMPTKNPPHKEKQDFVSDNHRINMVELAIRNNPNFELSIMEFERSGVTYTADTLTLLNKEYPDIEYYFIIGADSLFMIQDWKTPQVVFDKSIIVVAGRDHVQIKQMERQLDYLRTTYQARIIPFEMPTIEISSSDIRKRVAENKSIRYYVPYQVVEYIKKHRLYKITSEESLRWN